MTHLRKMMLEALERRNYAQTTIDCYIQAIEDFAQHFRSPPDQLTPEQFMLGGAPEAHEVLSKTPRIDFFPNAKCLPEAFPIKASDHPGTGLVADDVGAC